MGYHYFTVGTLKLNVARYQPVIPYNGYVQVAVRILRKRQVFISTCELTESLFQSNELPSSSYSSFARCFSSFNVSLTDI